MVEKRLFSAAQDRPMATVNVEVIVAIAGEPQGNGFVLTAEALRKAADGVRLFWNEERQALIFRGPVSALPYEPVMPNAQSRGE